MTTTTMRAALARIDWIAVGRRVDHAIRIAVTTAQLLLTLATIAWDIAYEHRREIRQALVTAFAATYLAGVWTRLQLERINSRSVALLPQQPIDAIAPITATLAAAREALERLIARLYPAVTG